MKLGTILKREKFAPITLMPGDQIVLEYREPGEPTRRLATHTATVAQTFDEGIIFDGEFEGRAMLGGAVIEQESSG